MKKLQVLALLLTACSMFTMTGCGKAKENKEYKDNYVIAKVNEDVKVDYATAYAYLRMLQAEAYSYTQSMLSSNNATADKIWSNALNDDSGYATFGEQFKGESLDSLKEMMLCQVHSDDYEVSFSDEDEKSCSETVSKFIKNMDENSLKAMHADEDSISNVLKLLTVEERVKNKIEADIDTEVSNDEAGQSTFSYIKITKKDNKNPDKIAKKIIKNTKNGTDFSTAASDEGFTAEDVSFTTTIPEYEEYGKEMLKQALGMKDGDCDSYTDSNKNVIVMYMKAVNDSDATETKKNEIIEKRKTDAYDDVIKNWEKEDEVDIDKKAWESITVDDNTVFKTKDSNSDSSDGNGETVLDSGNSSVAVSASLSDGSDVNVNVTKGEEK